MGIISKGTFQSLLFSHPRARCYEVRAKLRHTLNKPTTDRNTLNDAQRSLQCLESLITVFLKELFDGTPEELNEIQAGSRSRSSLLSRLLRGVLLIS